jgi:hypothetical protein
MSIVRSLAVLTIVATASLAAASAQATTPRSSHAAQTQAASQAETTKRTACERVWAAQKVRHGTRQAFVAACVAKG